MKKHGKKHLRPYSEVPPFEAFSVHVGSLGFHYRPLLVPGGSGYSVFAALQISSDDHDPGHFEYSLVVMDVAFRAAMDTDQLEKFNI